MGAVENLHPIYLPLLRTTQTGTWMRCPRRYRFEHVRGVVPTEDALALRIGTVWHKGMEGYLAAIRDGGDVLDGLRAISIVMVLLGHLLERAACRPPPESSGSSTSPSSGSASSS